MDKKGKISVVITAVVAIGLFLMYLPSYKKDVISENQDKRNEQFENATYLKNVKEKINEDDLSILYNTNISYEDKDVITYDELRIGIKGVQYNGEHLLEYEETGIEKGDINIGNKEFMKISFEINPIFKEDVDFDLEEFLDRVSLTTDKRIMQKDNLYVNYFDETIYARNLGDNDRMYSKDADSITMVNRPAGNRIDVYYILDEFKKDKVFEGNEITINFEGDETRSYKNESYILKIGKHPKDLENLREKHYEKYKDKYKK